MTNHTADTSLSKTAKALGLALLLIIPVTLKWIWFLIKGVSGQQMNKSEKIWDIISNDFDKYAKNKGLEQIHIKTIENTKKYLNICDIVLDYGCATGTVAIEIADKAKEIHGIDISSKMIAAAKRKAAERKIENIDFAQSTIFDERLKRESFDVVLALGILHLVEDRQKVIKRINELLKPGGLIISATECMGEKKSFITILLSLLMKIGLLPSMMRFFKVSELEDSITNGNFQIVQAESLSHSPVGYFIVAKKI